MQWTRRKMSVPPMFDSWRRWETGDPMPCGGRAYLVGTSFATADLTAARAGGAVRVLALKLAPRAAVPPFVPRETAFVRRRMRSLRLAI